ncbi:hypothetical protein MJO29_001427 [Puccinia striiformis f. sp. tritici]|nr:hypothetical protein MJO29_001427 [Puccinia striiformis f. sp. tritici]
MAKDVARFVQCCTTCQQTKASTTAPTGKMLTPSFPCTPLSDLAIDFVGPLRSAAHYDMIPTCTCRLSGFTRIIPVLQSDTAEKTASRLFNGWMSTFGAPTSIMSNRDKNWTSKLWKSLMSRLNIRFHMSSAFHPQADGRSERTNKTIGQVLRSFTAKRQGKWLESLPAVEFAINSSVNVATGFSPFELVFGRKPRLFPSSEGIPDSPPSLSSWLKQREGAWADARDTLWLSRVKQAIQHNKHCRDQPPLLARSWVLLNSADWQGRHQGGVDKLKERSEGPYHVSRVFNHGQNIELALPDGDRRHPAFHVSKVKPYFFREEEAPLDSPKVAAKAAKDLEIISRFSDPNFQPPKAKPAFPPHLYQHPHSTQRALDTMDIDATTAQATRQTFTPFEILFRQRRRNASWSVIAYPPPESVPVAACTSDPPSLYSFQGFEQAPSGLPVSTPPAMSTSSAPPAQFMNQNFGFDEIYNDLSEAHLATVKVRLDTSRTGRIMVPVSFQVSPSRSVVASVLVDTGATANFINWKFIDNHQLPTRQRKTPIRCIGFDGNEGVGGTVTHDWAGRIHVSSVDSKEAIPFPSSFGVTCLGTVDTIFGLPWLNRQSWTASGSASGGHCFTLRSTEVFVVDACSLGEELEGKDNCALPPHHSMDISIKLREGAVPPFGGLYNLSVDEMSQLREYVDKNLNKGFIRVSSSPAAAPIFFVRVPGLSYDREAIWQVHDQELFAIVNAFQEWRAWLIDTSEPVLVMSDHANLWYFMDSQKLSDRQARWAAFLVSFNFTIQHVSGKDNPADPATRCLDFITGNEDNEHHRQLLSSSTSGLCFSDSSLGSLTVREVDDLQTSAEPQGSNSAPSDPVESHIDLSDPGFCQPTHRLKQMLQTAYLREPPVADEDDESPLTFEHGFWWLKD